MLKIAAAGAGLMFLGYCVYFDYKRHQDPNFKEKLKESRRRKKEAKTAASKIKLPNLLKTAEVQQFFMKQIHKGEELLQIGEIDEGLEHISYALAVCGQPQEMLGVMKTTLPPEIFAMLLERLPTARAAVARATLVAAAEAGRVPVSGMGGPYGERASPPATTRQALGGSSGISDDFVQVEQRNSADDVE